MLDARTLLRRPLRWLRGILDEEAGGDPDGWRDDPLSHPDLARMTPAQLADLPFERAPPDPGTSARDRACRSPE